MNTDQGLASPTMGGALPAGCDPLWLVSTQQVGSLRSSSSYQSSSSDSSSLLLTSVLDFFLDSSPSLSFQSSPSGEPLPVSPGLLLMVVLLAGTDFWLGLALLLDDLLDELPALEPSFLLESAQVMILSLFKLIWLVISFSELRLRKQQPPAATAATNAKAIMMFKGVKILLLVICLGWEISTQEREGSWSMVQSSRRGSDTDCGCTANIIQNNYILVASFNGLNNQPPQNRSQIGQLSHKDRKIICLRYSKLELNNSLQLGRFLVNEALSKIKVSKNIGILCCLISHRDGNKKLTVLSYILDDCFFLEINIVINVWAKGLARKYCYQMQHICQASIPKPA